jgi:hypothetical protein
MSSRIWKTWAELVDTPSTYIGMTVKEYEAALAAARDAALDEAAKVCDELATQMNDVAIHAAQECSNAIRALKEKK